MQKSFEDIIKNDAFKKLSPEKIESIKEIAGKIQGKSVPEAMNILNSYQKVLNAGKPISAEERELMIAVILNSMDDTSREKFLSAMKMVSMMKGSN